MTHRLTPRSRRLRQRAAVVFGVLGAAAVALPAVAWAPPAPAGAPEASVDAASAETEARGAAFAAASDSATVELLLAPKRVADQARAEAARVTSARLAAEAAAATEAARVAEWVAGVERAEAEAAEAARVAEWVAGVERAEAAQAARSARSAAEAERSAARSGEPSNPERSTSASGSGWAALRKCESGGNYAAVSSTGTYRGAYQFSRSTWNSVARNNYPHLVGVDPAAAAPADQDAMAQALFNSSGSRPWPHCGRHL